MKASINPDKATIFDVKRDCSEDGPGIRTTVFFKGCPLSCVWCQNPEGRRAECQLSYNVTRCMAERCGTPCTKVCPSKCIELGAPISVDFDACTYCGRCVSVCPTHALEPVGFQISLTELLYRIEIDHPFYRSTGGGVTLSGGEPTRQMDFIHAFLVELHTRGIHSTIETSGFFHYERFKADVLPYLNHIYYDFKLFDEAESVRFTGQSNKPVIANFLHLLEDAEIPVIPRIPLIPNITATKDNLQAISAFLKQHWVSQLVLLPYNPLWRDKAQKIGVQSHVSCSSQFMSRDELERCIRYI